MTGWQYVAAIGWILFIAAAAMLVIACGCIDDLQTEAKTHKHLLRVAVGVEIDHADCESCGRTICLCHTAGECPSAESLGCTHHEMLCWDCRGACAECRAEAQIEAAQAWLRDGSGR